MIVRLFPSLRALVYLKRISQSLERIAECAEVMAPPKPKFSRKVSTPSGEVFSVRGDIDSKVPTVAEMNLRYRDENPQFKADYDY